MPYLADCRTSPKLTNTRQRGSETSIRSWVWRGWLTRSIVRHCSWSIERSADIWKSGQGFHLLTQIHERDAVVLPVVPGHPLPAENDHDGQLSAWRDWRVAQVGGREVRPQSRKENTLGRSQGYRAAAASSIGRLRIIQKKAKLS